MLRIYLCLCVFVFVPGFTRADDVPEITAGRAGGEITIDGVLDEAAWTEAVCIPAFVNYTNGLPVAVQSRGWICWNDDALLLGFECMEPAMDQRTAMHRERDAALWEDDSIEIFMQVPGQTTYFQFIVNSLGTLLDTEHGAGDLDSKARVAAALHADRWTIEVSIPWVDIKGPPMPDDPWRMNFCRGRHVPAGTSTPDLSAWSRTGRSFHSTTRFGNVLFSKTPGRTSLEQGLLAHWRLDEGGGNIIADSSGNAHHGTSERVKWVEDDFGHALEFTGGGFVEIAYPDELALTGGAFTLAASTYPYASDKEGTVIGLSPGHWSNPYRLWIGERNPASHIKSSFAFGGKDDMTYFYGQNEQAINPDAWQHIAVVYDGADLVQYLDGEEVGRLGIGADALKKPIASDQQLRIGQGGEDTQPFVGRIRDVRIWNRGLSPAEVAKLSLGDEWLQVKIRQLTRDLTKTMARLNVLDKGLVGRFAQHHAEVVAELDKLALVRARLKASGDAVTADEIQTAQNDLRASAANVTFLETEEGVLAALPASEFAKIASGASSLAVLSVSPLSGDMILPKKPLPGHARHAGEVQITACRGEYEAASIVVYPFRAMRLSVACSDLEHDDSDAAIPSSSISIKGVKCWYQAGTAWRTEAQDKSARVLTPELLLCDDMLVKVDHEKQENFLRLDYAKGPEYHSISYTDETRGWPDHIFPGGRELPVRDSATLLPIDLPERQNKQFMITAHVPPDTAAGDYAGELLFSSGEEVLEKIPFRLRVLPFELAEPKRYDLKGIYHSSIYALQVLECGHDQHSRTREQMAAEYRNMVAHGVDNPMIFQLSEAYDLDLFAELLKLREEVGIKTEPVFLGIHAPRDANLGAMRKSDPETLGMVKVKAIEIMDVVEKVLGHRDVYFYGWDEGHNEELDEQRPIWEAIHETGGKVITSGYRPGMKNDPKGSIGRVGDLLDCFVSAAGVSREEADAWHKHGQMVWSYANPQAGTENPRVYRRSYGLEIWKANFDGAANFAYYAALHNPWNDLDYFIRDYLFVHPTIDGVVDTLAWEGYREGIDDIRYATTLRLAMEEAWSIKHAAKHRAARAAQQFLDTLDLTRDQNEIRAEMIGHILALHPEGD